jgi:hypothetical protein
MFGVQSMIGHPSLNGLATFLVYLITAGFCAINGRRSFPRKDGVVRHVARRQGRQRFWRTVSGVLLVLGLTRILDLQALAADLMRGFLQGEDLYEVRESLQLALVITISCFGALGLLVALTTLRRAEGAVISALTGAAALILFTMIRTVSLHDVDQMLGLGLGLPHFQLNNLIELSLLCWVGGAAFAFSRKLAGEEELARLRTLKLQERRRKLGERRHHARIPAEAIHASRS